MSFLSHLLGLGPTGQQKNLTNQQAQLAQEQAQAFRDVLPQYMKGIDWFSNYAGLGNFHPTDFGSQTGAAPPPNPTGSVPLGGLYNPPAGGTGADNSGWQWSPAGMNMPPPAAPVKQDIFGNSAARQANKNGGEGDPPPSASPGMGPNPYGASQQVQGPTAAPPVQQQMARPQSNMQQYMQSAGMPFNANQGSIGNHQTIQSYRTANQMGVSPNNPYLNNANAKTGGVNNQQLGIWNDPADALRNAQAQDAINHQNYLAQQQLKSNMGSRGLEDSSILGAGLTQMNNAANNQYANFRQNLAIGAGQEQANRIAQMMGALGGGMGMPQTAQQGYGNVSNELMQQQQMNNQLLGGFGQSAGQLYGMFGPNPYAAMMAGGY